MKNKTILLESLLTKFKHPLILFFEETEDRIEIERKIKSQKLAVNESLIDLYLWKGGINGAKVFDGTFIDLFSFGCFIDLSSAISLLLLDKMTNKIYDKKLPFIQSISGDTISIDLDIKSKNQGSLFLLAPSITLSYNFVSIYDSLQVWIETIIACYEKGAYKLIENGKLDIDYSLEAEISKDMNPNSDFWKN